MHQLAVKKQGPASFFAIASLSDTSQAQRRAGHYAEGEANARSAHETARKAFGARAGLTGGTAATLADCLIARNKLDEASELLQDIYAKAVAQLTGIPDWFANVNLSLAEIAYRRGDYAAARKEIEPAIPVFSRADGEPYQKNRPQRLLARVANSSRGK